MLNQWILVALSIGVGFNYGACAQDTSVVTTTCYPDSFNQGSCTMKCTLTTNETLLNWSWNYFTTSENYKIEIYDGVQLTNQNETYTISLTLDDYNSGTYQCQFYFTNIPSQSLNAEIKISEATNGADLYEECNVNHDCIALHATCTDYYSYYTSMCMCNGEYYMFYSSGGDTLTCLKLQTEGGHCYSQSECSWPSQSYDCIDSHCHCKGNMTLVNIDGTETDMCLQPAYLNDYCDYDEQCELATEHSYCYEDTRRYEYKNCDCEKRYSMGYGISYKDNYCYYTGLEGWQIACIVLGTLFGLAIIGSAIYYFLKNPHQVMVS